MPQATDEQRATMAGYFGGSGIDDAPPYRFLKRQGWTERAGMLIAPHRDITQKEWDCLGFLCDEWDYGYDPALTIG